MRLLYYTIIGHKDPIQHSYAVSLFDWQQLCLSVEEFLTSEDCWLSDAGLQQPVFFPRANRNNSLMVNFC
jgi:hypothetical protein